MNEIYMDYNATTPVRDEVRRKILEVLQAGYGNPSSVHAPGRRARMLLDEAREQVASALGARTSEIVFTGGGSESDNLAIKGVALTIGRGHIITSVIEHPAVLNACGFLENAGYEVTYLPVDSCGRVQVDMFRRAVRDDTILASIMWANNETGVVQPVEELASEARERGIVFHTDAVQAFGKVPVDVGEVPVNLLSISGHKFYAPKGVGALYIRRGLMLEPLIHGGGQERGLRGGTENVAGAVALGLASLLASEEIEVEGARLAGLRDDMERRILKEIRETGVNGLGAERLPNTSNITFKGAEAEAILINLDEHGIAASSASACSSGQLEASHVLTAMGLSKEDAISTMRFSLGRQSRKEHVDRLVGALPEIVENLRGLAG